MMGNIERTIFIVVASLVFFIAVNEFNRESEIRHPVEVVSPIGYTLYDITNNRIIDISPCPHSWRLVPDWYSVDQWSPEFGYKYDFAYGVASLGGIIVELKPKDYIPPESCGPAYRVD